MPNVLIFLSSKVEFFKILCLNLSNLWSYGRRFKTRDTLWCVVQKQRNYSYTESKRVHVQGVKMDLKLDPVGSSESYEIMNWVSVGQQWLVLGGTESVYGGTGWFLMALGQYRACIVSLDMW